MKRDKFILSLLTALSFLVIFAVIGYSEEIVRLPLSGNLTDVKGGLTDGKVYRDSAATYVNTGGTLTTAHGSRENLVTDADDPDTAFTEVAVNTPVFSYDGGSATVEVNNTDRGILEQSKTLTANTTYILSGEITAVSGSTGHSSMALVNYTDIVYSGSTYISWANSTVGRKTLIFTIGSDTSGAIRFGAGTNSAATGDNSITWKDFQLEALPSGNVIGDDLFDQETTTAVTSGSDTVVGTVYKIVSRSTLDFTTVGSTANDAGEYFIATAVDTLGAGDELAQIDAPAKGIPYDADTTGQAWPGLAGSELISNGTFDTDTTGWTAYSAILTQEDAINGRDDVIQVAEDGSWTGAYQDVTTTVGQLYKLTALIYSDVGLGADDVCLIVGNSALAVNTIGWGDYRTYNPIDTNWNEHELYFTAKYTSTRIILHANSIYDGWFDDVSLRPVQVSWTPYGTNTIEIDETEEAVKVTYVDSNAGANLYLSSTKDLSENLVVGDWYQLDFQAKAPVGLVGLVVESTPDALLDIGSTFTDYTLVFVADNATFVSIYFAYMGAGESVFIRNLSIKAIPPLALLEPSDFATGTIPAQSRFESEGLLVEGEAVNLLDYSWDFEEWTHAGITTTEPGIAPDGETYSDISVVGANADGQTYLYYSPASALLDSTDYTFSIFAKSGDKTWACLRFRDKTPANTYTYFNLSNCSIGATDENDSSYAEAVGNGWCRLAITNSSATGSSSVLPVVYVADSNGDITTQGDASTINIYVFGAQLEETPYPTSYIPTNGSPAWRTTEAADSGDDIGYRWTMGQAVMDAIKDGTIAGTLIFDFVPGFAYTDITGPALIINADSGSANLFYIHPNENWLASFDSTTAPPAYVQSDYTAELEHTIAIRWSDALDSHIVSKKVSGSWTHGAENTLDADGFLESGTLWLGYGNEFPFHIKRIRMFDTYLDSADGADSEFEHLGNWEDLLPQFPVFPIYFPDAWGPLP